MDERERPNFLPIPLALQSVVRGRHTLFEQEGQYTVPLSNQWENNEINLPNRVKARGNGVTALLHNLASQFQSIAHLLSAQRRRERERRRHKTFGHPVKLDVRARGQKKKDSVSHSFY